MTLKSIRRAITHNHFFKSFLSLVIAVLLRIYFKTLKITIIDKGGMLKRSQYVTGVWHGQLFLSACLPHTPSIATLVDTSWIGDLTARVLERQGRTIIHGSSKHNPVRALVQLIKVMKAKNIPAAIALDGPRGPLHEPKPGIFFLAEKVQCPVVPITTKADRYWVIPKTWCQFEIPKPFARCVIALDYPLEQRDKEGLKNALYHLEAFAEKNLNSAKP